MHVEECTHALLEQILPTVDPHRQGWCIDVGVGTFALYCELFADLGYPTAAVEPLPIEKVRILCDEKGIALHTVCLSDVDGSAALYLGEFQGDRAPDLCSLSAGWWGASTETVTVKTLTLNSLLAKVGPARLTCLKLDIEGAECRVLSSLPGLTDRLHPDVVVFEYGGGATRSSRTAGWSEDFLDDALRCFELLGQCGYGQCVLIDADPGCCEQTVDLQAVNLDADHLFGQDAVYGNAVCLRSAKCHEQVIHRVCRPYRQEDPNRPESAHADASRRESVPPQSAASGG